MEKEVQVNEQKRICRENIRARRLELGLTQVRVSELSGVAQANLAQIESGTAGLSLEALVKLANALETTPAAILTPGVFSAVPA